MPDAEEALKKKFRSFKSLAATDGLAADSGFALQIQFRVRASTNASFLTLTVPPYHA